MSCDHDKRERAKVQMLWEGDDEDSVNELESKLRRLRVVMVAVRAACRLKLLSKLEVCGNMQPSEAELGCLGIETIVHTRDLEKLGRLGGVRGVARLLQTNVDTGISAGAAVEDEFARRRRHFGKNEYPQKSGETLWRFFCEARNDITLNLLVLSGILSLALGIISEGVQQGWYDGVSILFAVFLVVVVTAVSDFRQSRQFHSLDREKDNIPVQVVRAGRRTGVSIFDIVVGDLVELRIGDQVPADGLFLRGQCLAISESSLTGESKLFLPNQHNPFLLSGCKVEEGYGSMLVTAVGTDREWGHTMVTAPSNDNAEETPLQARLSSVAVAIGKVGLLVAVLVLVVLLIFYFTGHTRGSCGVEFRAENTSVSQILNSIVKIFSIALALVVVAVPEGLPLPVTLSLADPMRRVSACETIGSATTICTHKTGILTMNGRWDDKEMREKLPRVAVIPRSLPSDKLLLVKFLQSMGDVVAVTGADTNDAPALHQANIGLSMGIEGTEVAKQSSDIVILDDDFASVGRVVQRGRAVFSNIQNFLRFRLTVNVVALAVNFLAAVTSGTVPLTAVQLLWVNLLMDTLGALQLATQPPGDDLMSRPPVRHGEPLLTNTMWRNMAFQAAYQVAILLTLQFHGESLLHLHGRKDAALINRTIIFNTFVLCQVFNGVNARHLNQRNIFQGILRRHLFLGITAATLVVQVVMVEFLEKFASTTRLDWHHWVLCIGLASLSWPIDFVVKSIPIPRSSKSTQC